MLGHKIFYYGFGIGMTMTALLLLLNTLLVSDVANKEEAFDVYKLTEKANELNYSVYSSDEDRYTQEQLDAKIDGKLKESTLTNPIGTTAFLIQDGMNSSDVGIILFELDLISKIEDFETKMTELDLHRKIKKGVYIFEESEDLIYIINKITE